ncbi:hypothetical protein GCM10007170_34140 [Arthrobacter liuii]|uniref:Integral membrane protein n=1 Tax=Arthrobacter liuii TaxID=1476996 RepID=A0ABQ2AVU6_9MICC|nr:hypothetical protein GCM10007170_34140 [Arthrobacter liuii]
MNPLSVVPVSLMLILLGSLTFKRINTPVTGYEHALRGKASSIALSGIFLTLAYVLLLPPVYIPVDSVMPVTNTTDLISKYFALIAVAFLGGHLSVAYASPFARRWTVGAPGAVMLGVVATGLLGTLLATNAPRPSPQLLDYAAQPSVRLNTWLVLAYVAYIVFPLIGPAYRDARKNPLRVGRLASGLIAGGFALSLARAFTYPIELGATGDVTYLFMIVSYISTAFVVIGLALFAYARRSRKTETELGSALSID